VKQDRLDSLQERVLLVLAGTCPGWRLTGGAALAGFHLGHRTTRDLDLLWGGCERLARIPEEVRAALAADQLSVVTVQSAPSFHRMRVTDGHLVTVLDLVAEPAAPIEPPEVFCRGETKLVVDTPYEILVNKLCTLLGRAELRDLEDVGALLARGGDLERAMADAPRKDGGFSALTLAWVLENLDIQGIGSVTGLGSEQIVALDRIRRDLVEQLLRASRPA